MLIPKCDCCWNSLENCGCSEEEKIRHKEQSERDQKALKEFNERDRHYSTKYVIGWRDMKFCFYCGKFITPFGHYNHCCCKEAIKEWQMKLEADPVPIVLFKKGQIYKPKKTFVWYSWLRVWI